MNGMNENGMNRRRCRAIGEPGVYTAGLQDVAPHSPGFTPPGYIMSPRSGARRNEKETFVAQRIQGLRPGLQAVAPFRGSED
jgi:hypothetical protein